MNIERLLEDCFEHLGIEVSYCDHKRKEISKMKALVKCPDTAYSLGIDGKLTQQIAFIEIRSQDVVFLSLGDYIKIGNKFYKIFEQPLRDPSGSVWTIQAAEC